MRRVEIVINPVDKYVVRNKLKSHGTKSFP